MQPNVYLKAESIVSIVSLFCHIYSASKVYLSFFDFAYVVFKQIKKPPDNSEGFKNLINPGSYLATTNSLLIVLSSAKVAASK